MYFVAFRLSVIGWYVTNTARNVRGADLLIYNESGRKRWTVQVKSLSWRNQLPYGKPENLIADFYVVCIRSDEPREPFRVYAARRRDFVRKVRAYSGPDEGYKRGFLDPKSYESFGKLEDVIGPGGPH